MPDRCGLRDVRSGRADALLLSSFVGAPTAREYMNTRNWKLERWTPYVSLIFFCLLQGRVQRNTVKKITDHHSLCSRRVVQVHFCGCCL